MKIECLILKIVSFLDSLEMGSECTCGRKSTVLRQNSSVARCKSHVLKPVTLLLSLDSVYEMVTAGMVN